MHRFITAALIGVAALAFAGAAEAFQCPKLVGQINATAGNRFDAAASEARIKAAEADRLHKEASTPRRRRRRKKGSSVSASRRKQRAAPPAPRGGAGGAH